jgi:hypothetical protein
MIKKIYKLKKMKKSILIAFSLMMLLFFGCSKDDDFTDPENLSGTEWKSFDVDFPDEEDYYIFKFISNTVIELWIKEKEGVLYKEWTGIYTINGKTISIDFGDGDIISGVIEGNKMNFAYDGEIIVFTKQ